MSTAPPQGGELRHSVGRGGFFTLAFGAIVGSGWIVVLGDWLRAGGPAGSALGFAAGGVAIILVSLCYGELAARSPTAGAEFLYTLQTFGKFPAFLVGWFLTLYTVTVCGFEAIALAWLLRTLFPAIALPTAYSIAGAPVTWDALLIGVGATLAVAVLHYRGATSAIRFQNIVTCGFIVACILVIGCGMSLGSVANLQPLFYSTPGHPWISGTLWMFATSAFFLNGWQTSLHAIEERRADVSARGAVLCMIAAIAAAAAFYATIILSAAMSHPWMQLMDRELPAISAFAALGFGGFLGTFILVAATVSLAKSWSACAWMATRLLFAQARHGFLPNSLSKLDDSTRAPRNAISFVTVATLVGLALGRGAITPIVNMLSICSALSMILCLLVLIRRRWRSTEAPPSFVVPGGLPTILCALIGVVLMVGVAIVEPLMNGHGRLPLEWILLLAWGGLGIIIWLGTARLRIADDSGR